MADQEVAKATSSPMWEAVSQWLVLTDPDLEYWWKLTGPQLSHMVKAAGWRIGYQLQY